VEEDAEGTGEDRRHRPPGCSVFIQAVGYSSSSSAWSNDFGPSQNLLGCDREQSFVPPPSLDERLPADHFARFMVAAVEAMELWVFYDDCRADGHGHPAHDPAMMVALPMYAYAWEALVAGDHRHRVSPVHSVDVN
jgi:hypothetical protein